MHVDAHWCTWWNWIHVLQCLKFADCLISAKMRRDLEKPFCGLSSGFWHGTASKIFEDVDLAWTNSGKVIVCHLLQDVQVLCSCVGDIGDHRSVNCHRWLWFLRRWLQSPLRDFHPQAFQKLPRPRPFIEFRQILSCSVHMPMFSQAIFPGSIG